MAHSIRRRRLKLVGVLIGMACIAGLSFTAAAYAYSQFYGYYAICGTICYVQSSGDAHSYSFNSTIVGNGGYMACQLFNYSGYNEVRHGYGTCTMQGFPNLPYKWARAYNQSGYTSTTGGYAATD